MLKGAQKRMIVVKTNESRVFEEAYFVVRREAETERMDMLAEANKIIEGCGGGKRKKDGKDRGTKFRELVLFLGGGLAGGGVAAFIMLVVR